MTASFSATVEFGCECGEAIELPMEQARRPFICPTCDHEHVLGEVQLKAIEDAFGRAFLEAYRLQSETTDQTSARSLAH